ncbi:MAG: LON peptidase substrate-binding domain-containing protein [Ekhidna sp.]|nr:LON peptidase substrate-binding domain-containing protein [Ekhidna sp.]
MKIISLFPLNLVAFPGEEVNLHIFEPRYKQLVNDCLEGSGVFGIPSYVTNKIELGTEVMITEVTKAYADGRMDIKTKALNAFKVNDYWNPWGRKLYAGGEVLEIEEGDFDTDLLLLLKLKKLSGRLFAWLDIVDFPDVSQINSVYEIGHKIGLKLEEEYKLLSMTSENDRLQFTIRHLEKLLPALERVHFAQERIKQNGHFKHLDPLEF